jgi:hypothetical protein
VQYRNYNGCKSDREHGTVNYDEPVKSVSLFRQYSDIQCSRQRFADADSTVAGEYQWWIRLEQHRGRDQREPVILQFSIAEWQSVSRSLHEPVQYGNDQPGYADRQYVAWNYHESVEPVGLRRWYGNV